MKSNKFKFPDIPLENDIPLPHQKVMVVSFFGKSQYSAKSCKSAAVEAFPGRQIFQTSLLDDPTVDPEMLGYLCVWAEIKHKYARALMFLFIVSHVLVLSHPTHSFDISYIYLFRALDATRQKVQNNVMDQLRSVVGIPKEWINAGRPCAPRVLFLFETCPAPFRDVPDGEKSKVMDMLRNAGATNKSQAAGKPSIKKLEHSLEDQIYRILRKSRVVTNNSSNSLFAIPANQEFVFVNTKVDPSKDRLSYMVNSLVNFCKDPNSDPTRNRNDSLEDSLLGLHPDSHGHNFRNFLQQHIDLGFHKGFDDNVGRHALPSYFEVPQASLWFDVAGKLFSLFMTEGKLKQGLTTLRNLLDTDIKFSEGRCGKVLPLATASYQENLPSHYTRDYHERKLAHAVSVFAVHARGPLFEQYVTQLERECDRHWKNGRQMCEVLSLTGNPCTNPLHRGGGEGAGGGELQGEAKNADDDLDEESRDLTQLPMMEHSSGVRYVAACNCGRKQGPREDPFTVRGANYEYYQLLAEDCGCCDLETIRFPVFQPSTQDFKAAQLFSNINKTVRKDSTSRCADGPGFVSGGSDLHPEEAVSRLSLQPPKEQDGHEIVIQVSDADSDSGKDKALLRQPSTTEYLPGMLHADSPSGLLPQFPSWSLVCLGPSSLYSHNLGLQDQQQAGLLGGSAYLLPWDVTVRLQHHSRDRGNSWPAVGDQFRHKQAPGQHTVLRGRKTKTGNKDLSEFVVKIFIGVEYECPRGHRFMCSAPDKVLKTTGSGLVKDNGNKVTGSDMPLYFPCPCRNAKPLVAQLMRIHVVTPKAPIHVTLNPRVQPAPAPCPVFITGFEQPIRLSQSAYWVLRLPKSYIPVKCNICVAECIGLITRTLGQQRNGHCFGTNHDDPDKPVALHAQTHNSKFDSCYSTRIIQTLSISCTSSQLHRYVYVGDHGPYVTPKEPVPLNYGRLLAGMYSITEVAPEEK
uniref:Nonsense-mediated mRNA decay factor SMG8 n=2 Tax=Timema TaxID=61471 RepID=A0A7R9PMP0_TIMGE|nr:unnamed protein product [Timema genevievae]